VLVPRSVDSHPGYYNLAHLALALAATGNADRCVQVFEDLYEQLYPDPPDDFAADPRFDGIRDHPAFQRFVHAHAR
jgi:hypothetical protein